MSLKKIHHVAYRCIDAKETVNFYRDLLDMEFKLAIAEDKVPLTGAPDPYMHVFLDAGNDNVLASLNCLIHRRWDETNKHLMGSAHCI
ncbi:MAG: hypothetical protein Ct9H300mP8_08880 [Gammaproteobacteria bacterium]|nr:MAG: hypothetical protein Ct9H300mP8_08880 [Gammaproteobacteria bacterium]